MGFIYILTYNQKQYVGQTVRVIEQRFKEHQRPDSSCRALARAIKKYGWDAFETHYFEVVDDWDLDYIEMILIEELESLAPYGYNLKEGGGSRGKFSNETKQKMSEAKYGRTGELAPNYGKPKSEETKQKMSAAMSGEKHPMFGRTGELCPLYGRTGELCPNYGKPKSEETKRKMSEAKTGEKHHNSKRVYQYTLDGTYIDDFGSTGEAARSLGRKNGSNISACARGTLPTVYGFKWSYDAPDTLCVLI